MPYPTEGALFFTFLTNSTMLKFIPKTVLTSRVDLALKERLTAEAAQNDMTLSNYTEHVLGYFNTILSLNTDQDAQINDLIERIDDFAKLDRDANLEIERLELEAQMQATQIQKLRKENESLVNRIEQSNDENMKLRQELVKRLPLVLNTNELEKATAKLAELKGQHDDCTNAELLVLSLATAVSNEKNKFFMYNLKEFKNRNPYFLKSITIQQ
jgi:chromosome segregation ATPase